MKPISQTIFGDGKGDCFRACVASILEIPHEEMPNFCIETGDWIEKANKWLGPRGVAIFDVTLDKDGSMRNVTAMCDGMHVIISGKSPRGDFHHAVVGRYVLVDGLHQLEYVHDPHPSGDYLDGPAQAITLFLSTNPAELRSSRGELDRLDRFVHDPGDDTGTVDAAIARIEAAEAAIEEIRAVACGEEQVADSDGEGMLWIFKRCEAYQKTGEVTA